MRSAAVSNTPAAAIAFCVVSVAKICAGSIPSVASLLFDSSTKIFSSCSPMKSTLATPGTRSSSARNRSPNSFSCR